MRSNTNGKERPSEAVAKVIPVGATIYGNNDLLNSLSLKQGMGIAAWTFAHHPLGLGLIGNELVIKKELSILKESADSTE